MQMRNLLLAATILALPVAANAQSAQVVGPYVAGGLGFNYLTGVNGKQVSVPGIPGAFSSIPGQSFDSNGGLVGLGSVGWGFGNGLRAEIEGNYRGQHVRVGNGNNSVTTSGGGTFQTYGVMVNGLYDFNIGKTWTPYVGLGVGYEWSQFNSGNLYSLHTTPQIVDHMNSNAQGGFAGQLILGAAFPTGMPGLALTVEGRLMDVFANEKFGGVATAGKVSSPMNVTLGQQVNLSALVGVRYNFGVAPAPVVAGPVTAVAPKSYLVFFDWDKFDLSARARQIIGEAAKASTTQAVTKIAVNGYTDNTGTAKYNVALSQRRAQAVAAELVKDGVAKSAIVTKGFGEQDPLVPTGPQTREPQNRRVEIVLQ